MTMRHNARDAKRRTRGIAVSHLRAIAGATTAALFSVVLAASDATAACAWIMWQDHTWRGTPSSDKWTPVGAFEKSGECRIHEKAKVSGWLSKGATSLADNVVQFHEGPFLTIRVLCLPDTIDPRGPKGGSSP